jgi:two-component system sensor histidine kinase AlgZ
METLVEMSAQVQPVLLMSLLLLAAMNPLLQRLPYVRAAALLLVTEMAVATAVYFLGHHLFNAPGTLGRYWLFTLLTTGVLVGYFDLRARALSPALTEARLQALQARIRPHFLFNSINAVLSLMRQDPRRAEQVIEDLAEMFRVLMADNRQLTPFAQEIELAKQYLNIEQLRLGDRLRVEWDIADFPGEALIPPLVLQPLLENAVYHGIEPRVEPGVITIQLRREGDRVRVVLRNPYRPENDHHAGNHMALANIRERLQLHFDAEASIKTVAGDGTYEVQILMPYVTGHT